MGLEEHKMFRTADDIEREVFQLYPNYSNKELHKTNFATQKRAITLDVGELSEKLLAKLQTMDNFTLRNNAEVSTVNASPMTGLVRGVTVQGKLFKEIETDALVICTGAFTAQLLYSTLKVFAPIIPVKSYTFDVPTTTPFHAAHFYSHKSALSAVQLKPGTWRISAFGDMAGLNLDLDQRRVRTAKNTVCITMETKEGLLAKDIKAVLHACSPDDLPVVGALKRHPNVYVNSGHGGRNCAFSIGSSKLLAELLASGKFASCDEAQVS